ncbi:MAG: histidine kinase dimerization/phospho-acceptor domain-containing protein, partial [Balneolaceae bacterium]
MFLLSTSVYANTEVVAPADTIDEVQPLNKVLRVQHQTGVRAAYLDLLEWELFDNEEYSSEEILSGNIKGTPHPFDLNSDTVVQKLPSEIWIQAKFTIPESHFNTYVFLSFKLLGETQVYWNGELIESYGAADTTGGNSPHLVARSVNFDRLQFSEDSLQTLTFRMNIEHIKSAKNKLLSTPDLGILSPELYFLQEEISAYKNDRLLYRTNQTLMWAFGFCLMIIALLNIGLEGVTKVKINELAIGFLLIFVGIAALNIDLMFFGYDFFLAIHIPSQIAILLIFLSIPNHIALKANKFTRRQKIYNSVFLLLFIDIIFPLDFLRSTLFGDFAEDMFLIIFLLVIMLHIGEAIYTSYKQNKAGQKEFLVFLIAFFLMLIGIAGRFLFYFFPAIFNQFFNLLLISFITLSVPLALLVIPIFEVIYTNRKLRDSLDENEQLNNLKLKAEQEKKTLIESRKKELEKEVKSRTSELGKAYENLKKSHEELKAAQSQLVQQEKLASLGQLTAGIAHEIKNPLNFVNNFSDLSVELIEEVREEIQNSGVRSQNSEVLEILDNIEANLRKIHEHGSRADSIVKSMLQHSRGGSGKMESTDLNALVKEYVNLSFHGKRA